jgi:hypothetical protein
MPGVPRSVEHVDATGTRGYPESVIREHLDDSSSPATIDWLPVLSSGFHEHPFVPDSQVRFLGNLFTGG